MGKFKDTLIGLGGLGLILLVGVVLIAVFGGLSMGIQWLWKQIPFGVAGLILGSIIVCGTFFFAKQIYPDRKFSLKWEFLNELEAVEIIFYLFGFVIVFSSVLWFIVPNSIFRNLPSFGTVLVSSIIGTLLFYGASACLSLSIVSLRIYILGSLFYLACGIFGVVIVNLPIWNYTNNLPTDYYLLGKAIFLFIFFIQSLYIFFFHIMPAIRQFKKESAEAKLEYKKDES